MFPFVRQPDPKHLARRNPPSSPIPTSKVAVDPRIWSPSWQGRNARRNHRGALNISRVNGDCVEQRVEERLIKRVGLCISDAVVDFRLVRLGSIRLLDGVRDGMRDRNVKRQLLRDCDANLDGQRIGLDEHDCKRDGDVLIDVVLVPVRVLYV